MNRRIVRVQPTTGMEVGPSHLEAKGQVPVRGTKLPVGNRISIGTRLTRGLEPIPMGASEGIIRLLTVPVVGFLIQRSFLE